MFNDLSIEKGSSGTKLFGGRIYEEYNPKFSGQRAYDVYDEMRRSDAQVFATLNAMELPIRSTLWHVKCGETEVGGESQVTPEDEAVMEFVKKALFDKMNHSFDDFLRQALTMLTFGFSIFEKVYYREGDRIYVKKLAQRLPRTVWKWNKDENTGRPGIEQFLPMSDDKVPTHVVLPADKIIVFSFRREGDNFEGVSVLRSAYKHWYMKDTLYKLDAVKHERQAIGIPVITMPQVHGDGDADEAANIAENVRATEKSYIILPSPEWKFEFANMGAGSTADVEKSIAHHNREISKNILAQFLELGASGGGSYALSEDQSSLFLLSLSSIASQICEQINRELIPELVDMNFNMKEGQTYPTLSFRRLGEVAYQTFATALSTLTSSGLLTPDDELEEHVREVMDLPKKMETPEDEMEEPQEEDTASMDEDANATAEDEMATEDMTSEEDAANADIELQKLEDEMNALEASELEDIASDLCQFEESEMSLIFRAPIDNETRKKISEALKEYWKTRGKKQPDDLSRAGKLASSRSKSATQSIKDAQSRYDTNIKPMKDQIANLKNLMKDPSKKKQAKAMMKDIKNKIAAMRTEKNASVKVLREIKAKAIMDSKSVKVEMKARKTAIEGVIKKVRDDVSAKNATRSQSIMSLADQIRGNNATAKNLYEQAKGMAQGKSKSEKAAIMKNARTLIEGIKGENTTLRNAATKLRDEARSEKDTMKSKVDAIREAADMKKKPTTSKADPELMKKLGFSDMEDMQAFSEAMDLFDPRVILNVQNHVSDDE